MNKATFWTSVAIACVAVAALAAIVLLLFVELRHHRDRNEQVHYEQLCILQVPIEGRTSEIRDRCHQQSLKVHPINP